MLNAMRPAGTGGPSQLFVVKDHDMPVSSQLTVKLDHVRAGFDRFGESQASIFRIQAGRASMSNFLKPGMAGTANTVDKMSTNFSAAPESLRPGA